MRLTPRQFLAALAFVLVVVGIETWRFPPEFLALAPLWCCVALLAGLTCLAAALRPRRFYIASSGACTCCACAARGFALVIEWVHASNDVEAGYVVGALTWWTLAMTIYLIWREYILPWSVGMQR